MTLSELTSAFLTFKSNVWSSFTSFKRNSWDKLRLLRSLRPELQNYNYSGWLHMPIGNEAWNAEVLSVEGERLWGLQPKWENDENGYLLIPTMHNHDVSAITSRKVFVRLTNTEIPRGSLIKSVFLYLDGRMQYDPADLTPAPKVSI